MGYLIYLSGEIVLFDGIVQHHLQIWPPDFLQVVVDPGVGFVDFDDAVQINGGAYDHRITFGTVNRGFKVF